MNLKINSFRAFTNFSKNKTDKSPTMRGEMLVECQHCKKLNEFDLSIWGQNTKTGKPMLTGMFQPPDFESEYYKKRKADDLKSLEDYKKTPQEREKDLPF